MNITNTVNFAAEILSSSLLIVTLETFDYNLACQKSKPEKKFSRDYIADEKQFLIQF